MDRKRTFAEECQAFSDAVHQIGRIIAEAYINVWRYSLAWLAGHAIRLYQWIEDWRENRKG